MLPSGGAAPIGYAKIAVQRLVRVLASGLRSTPALQLLDLESARIGAEGVKAFAEALEANLHGCMPLQNLLLSGNQLCSRS